MNCDPDILHDYANDAMSADGRAALERHLESCAGCRSALVEFATRREGIATRMNTLDPRSPDETADAALAYARFRNWTRTQSETRTDLGSRIEKRTRMLASIIFVTSDAGAADLRRRWRPAIVGAGVLAGLIFSISYAPARQKLAEFLSIFRVKEFSIVSIDPSQMEKLGSLQKALGEGNLITPTEERAPGKPRPVETVAEATSLAGFAVAVPTELPEGLARTGFEVVSPGPMMRADFDPAQIEGALAAAGFTGIRLPEMKAGSIQAEVAAIALLSYEGTEGDRPAAIRIVEALSPTVTLPVGVDPKVLGETYLTILGVPPEDAHRLAQTIDWTGTMILPVPRNFGSFREVKIGDAAGIYMEQTRDFPDRREAGDPARDESATKSRDESAAGAREQAGEAREGGFRSTILWQKDGIVTAIMGRHVTGSELLRIAESMR
jgi:hypothetical protein